MKAPSSSARHAGASPLQSTAPIFAIHGSASTGRQWQSLAACLGSASAVIAPDLPGYGGTPPELDRLSYLEAALWQVPGPVDLAAHSFGGAVALMLANRNPGQVRSVTLYDPVMPVADARGAACMAPDLRALWTGLRGQPAPVMMARFLDFWCAPGMWDRLSPQRQAGLIALSGSLTRDFEEICAGVWTVPCPDFRGPVTILRGSLSPRVTVDVSDRILAQYPQTRCSVMLGLGHMAPLTHPDQVNPAIAATLSGVPARCAALRAVRSAA